jgi:RNA polymerase sigma factor (sigma-70 family)
MEVSALTNAGAAGLHGRSPLLRLQSDERLIALVRRGNHGAFEVLVSRYQSRLHAFCRHMLGSREDAEDVLQEVFAAAFNAILADERAINVRPWLYRIARNRSLNHLRRVQPIGVDSMDVHLSEHGTTTADKVDRRESLRELLADVQELPETQRTALLLREIDALSYEQIAEAMETTIPSVKSLLVRARVSLAEAAEGRRLSCEEVRLELGEIAEGLRRRTTPPVRRHVRACERCAVFRTELRATSKGLALALPVGPLLIVKKLLLAHLGLSAGAGGAGGTASGTAAVGAVAGTAAAGSGSAGSLISAGIGAVVTKAAAGIAATAIVAAGAVEIQQQAPHHARPLAQHVALVAAAPPAHPVQATVVRKAPPQVQRALDAPVEKAAVKHPKTTATTPTPPPTTTTTTATTTPAPAATGTVTSGQVDVESSTTSLPTSLPQTTTVAAAPPVTVPPPATTPTTTTPPPDTTPPPTPTPTTSTAPPPPPTTTTPSSDGEPPADPVEPPVVSDAPAP